MENKLTIGMLAGAMARTTGKSRKSCEDFSKEFFKVVAENLKDGETLKIKGFGNFKLAEVESRTSVNVNTGEPYEIARHKKVVFTPAKELASAINAPFEEFASVEMDDDIPEEIFNEDYEEEKITGEGKNSAEEKISDENNVSAYRLEEGSEEEGSDDVITYEAYKEIEDEKEREEEKIIAAPSLVQPEEPVVKESPVEEVKIVPPVIVPSAGIQEPTNEEEEPEEMVAAGYPVPQKSRFGIGFLTGALSTLVVFVVIFMLGCFFDWWPVNFGSVKDLFSGIGNEQVENSPQNEDVAVAVPEEAAPEPVYDTVSTTRYLTTISREHYGDFNFWPYIYLENESILGHPDRITPGTKVIVPPLSKYGVDPTNKEDVKKAKEKGFEIYARFKK